MRQQATLEVPGLKVAIPLHPDQLPTDLVPPDGPPGEPTIELVLEGSPLTVLARPNGKNFRKILRTITEQGAGNVAVIMQGTLRPPATKGGPYILEGAGFQVNVKTPKPTPAQDALAGTAQSEQIPE